MTAELWRRSAAEAIGTALLVIFGAGSFVAALVVGKGQLGYAAIGIIGFSFAFVIAAAVYVFGPISGARSGDRRRRRRRGLCVRCAPSNVHTAARTNTRSRITPRHDFQHMLHSRKPVRPNKIGRRTRWLTEGVEGITFPWEAARRARVRCDREIPP
ncbi:aquaporin [Streptomyces brevispora]|uniref:aquaporin n=1 Tax=Streptomyces brevispora TaxID=887462 RepID=UPI0035D6DEE2